MNKLLVNEIKDYLLRDSERTGFRISHKTFSNEEISNCRILYLSNFKEVIFLNVNFSEINFESSFFKECVFKNCVFDKVSFSQNEFEDCKLINCQIKDCDLSNITFTKTVFDNSCFTRTETGSLTKAWFESCHFLETDFNGFNLLSVIQAAVVDSKFSKFDKSIQFNGEFFLFDILYSIKRISTMFIE
jgi:uncharacterized protein YjbI with pentapeptide repeats